MLDTLLNLLSKQFDEPCITDTTAAAAAAEESIIGHR